ncbi:hypothetical protein [Halodesulfurarchaeum sp.]|uniref:hypothetical protein n=1 Tax=Halodesulfurarchaeum sp. TaxID=1980530 RepID=UPI001BC2B02C|nr:hypothetical protein [Halodesulfurarchaeum sp.]
MRGIHRLLELLVESSLAAVRRLLSTAIEEALQDDDLRERLEFAGILGRGAIEKTREN